VIGRKLQHGRQRARVLAVLLSRARPRRRAVRRFTQETSPRNLAGIVVPVLYLGLLNTPSAGSWFRAHTY
jgi:hypothetical protein